MSNQGVLAIPQTVEIAGRATKLHPLGLYELGLCESSFSACLTRQALEASTGLPDHDRKEALLRVAERTADLDIDVTPVIEWIIGTYEGQIRAISHCLETVDGAPLSIRDVGKWYRTARAEPEGVIDTWMVASRLRSDPTEGGSTKTIAEKAENVEAAVSDTSTTQS